MSSHPRLVAILALSLIALPAAAQTVRAPTQTPAPPSGLRAPDTSPSSQGLSALALRIDALEQSVRRQIIVLEQGYPETERWPRDSDNFGNNNTRSQAICERALGDRYGRVISRERTFAGDYYFLHRVVCETR